MWMKWMENHLSSKWKLCNRYQRLYVHNGLKSFLKEHSQSFDFYATLFLHDIFIKHSCVASSVFETLIQCSFLTQVHIGNLFKNIESQNNQFMFLRLRLICNDDFSGIKRGIFSGSDKIIYWLSGYSFPLGFIMSKNPKGLWFYILIKSSVRNLLHFFDITNPRRTENLQRQ